MQGASRSKQDVSFSEKPASEKDFNEVVQIVNLFLLAWINCSLYPEGHTAAIKALENFKDYLESFLLRHSCLRLTAEKNKLLWNNTILLECSQPLSHLNTCKKICPWRSLWVMKMVKLYSQVGQLMPHISRPEAKVVMTMIFQQSCR